MAKLTLKAQKLLDSYFKKANALLAERGLTPHYVSEPLSANPSTEYKASTAAAGSVRVVVYDDWTHICFDEPAIASRYVACNKFSGKWNQHTFMELDKSRQTQRYLDDCLFHLEHVFDSIGLKP